MQPNSNHHVRVDSTPRRRNSSRSVNVCHCDTARLISQLRAAPEQADTAAAAAAAAGQHDGSFAASASLDDDVMVDDSIPDAAGTSQNGMQPPDGLFASQSFRMSVAASQRKPRSAEANRLAADNNWRQHQDPEDWIRGLSIRKGLVEREHAVIQDYIVQQ